VKLVADPRQGFPGVQEGEAVCGKRHVLISTLRIFRLD
jgi:hypothetical protein